MLSLFQRCLLRVESRYRITLRPFIEELKLHLHRKPRPPLNLSNNPEQNNNNSPSRLFYPQEEVVVVVVVVVVLVRCPNPILDVRLGRNLVTRWPRRRLPKPAWRKTTSLPHLPDLLYPAPRQPAKRRPCSSRCSDINGCSSRCCPTMPWGRNNSPPRGCRRRLRRRRNFQLHLVPWH